MFCLVNANAFLPLLSLKSKSLTSPPKSNPSLPLLGHALSNAQVVNMARDVQEHVHAVHLIAVTRRTGGAHALLQDGRGCRVTNHVLKATLAWDARSVAHAPIMLNAIQQQVGKEDVRGQKSVLSCVKFTLP